MSLNIKDPETHRLAKELAEATGETITEAVRTSVRERLHRVRTRPGLAERLLAIGDDAASRMSEEFRTDNPDDWLYDEDGLPK
jgi:antitoxin VapB